MSLLVYRLFWLLSLAISAGGAWIWLKIVSRADPGWKDKGHSWYLYVLGGIGSTYLSLVFYIIGAILTGGGFDSAYAAADDFWYSVLINGPAEEWAKFLVFWFIARGLGRVKEPRDGVIVAMMVALGFSLWENVNYLLFYGPGAIPSRLVWASSGHMAYAAVWGYFAGQAILEPPDGGRIMRYRYLIASVLVVSFIHGIFNFLVTWVSSGAGLVIDVLMYGATLAMLTEVCRVPSAYRQFPYSKAPEAVRRISAALERDPGNSVLLKRMGFYQLALGREERALSSWINIRPRDRGAYLEIWIAVLQSRRRGDSPNGRGSGAEFNRLLPALSADSRRTLKRRLKFFLKAGGVPWIHRIDDWEFRREIQRGYNC